MNQVVVVAVFAQVLHRTTAKGVGLGKTAGKLAQPLDDITVGLQVMQPQRQQAMLEQVETGKFNQADSRIEMRVGRAGNNIHRVPRIHQRLAQKPQINPLATAEGLAAVSEQRDPERALRRVFGSDWRRDRSSACRDA